MTSLTACPFSLPSHPGAERYNFRGGEGKQRNYISHCLFRPHSRIGWNPQLDLELPLCLMDQYTGLCFHQCSDNLHLKTGDVASNELHLKADNELHRVAGNTLMAPTDSKLW